MQARRIAGSKARNIFVNRDQPKSVFAEAVQNIPKDKALVRVFHGIGGQGKSALCHALYRDTAPAYGHLKRAHLDLRDQWSVDAVLLLVRIRNSFADTHVSFATFDLALALFWEVARSEQNLPKLHDGWIGQAAGFMGDLSPDVVQTVREACEDTVEMIPGLGKIATKLTRWAVKKAQNARLKHIRAEDVNMMFRHDDVKPPHELEALLPWFLAQDLNHHLEKNSGNRFVLFLDEYEGLFSQNKRWQENAFDKHIRHLVRESNGLLVVFFSREQLPWANEPQWKDELVGVHHELKGLDEKFAQDWLQQIPIADETTRQAMINGAREENKVNATILPFLLELQINYWEQVKATESPIGPELFHVGADHYQERCSELVSRLLRSYDTFLCDTLEYLSVVNRFDRAAFKAVISETGLAPSDFKRITKLSFIQKGKDGFFTMHRAMADAIYAILDEETRETAIDLLLSHYSECVENTVIKDVTQETLNALFEAAYLRKRCDVEGYVDWLSDISRTIGESARFAQIERLWEDALSWSQATWGEEHTDTATCYNNLGHILDSQSRYEEAAPLYQKSLVIRQRVLGEDHPYTAVSYNNVAHNLHAQGCYVEAETLYKRAFNIQQKVWGEDDPKMAMAYNNLGYNLEAQCHYEEAEPFFRKSLDMNKVFLGEDDLDTGMTYNNLGCNLNNQGRYKEAEKLCKEALNIRKRCLGEDHADTASSYNNVGYNLLKQGRYKEVGPFFQKALDIRQRCLGEDHADTASSYNNVAEILRMIGDYKEAELLYQKALDIRQRCLGEDHLDTAVSYCNFGINLQAQNLYKEAEPFFQKSLAILQRTLGEENPYTAEVYNGMGCNLDAQGYYEDAEALHKKSLAIRQRVLVEDHPDMAVNYINQGSNLNAQGRYEEAEPLYERAYEISTRSLGENDPHTKIFKANWEQVKKRLAERGRS